MNRRDFIRLTACGSTATALAWPGRLWAGAAPEDWNPHAALVPLGQPLRVQPVLMYSLPTRKEGASWRSWGGVQTEQAVAEEAARITRELDKMAAKSDFRVKILPLAKVKALEETAALAGQDYDVTLLYACTGGGDLLNGCLALKPDTIIFVRHQSGPVYYWYEALSTRFLKAAKARPATGGEAEPKAHVDDVVVDDYEEVRWRLRGMAGVKGMRGTSIVALGGVWGKYAPGAPQRAADRFNLKVIDVSYEAFAPRLKRAREDRGLLAVAEQWTNRYLDLSKTNLETPRKFVVNAFVLYRAIKDLMMENNAQVFTIKSCMGTIIPMAETTACLPLELLNDEGLVGFCESDFVVIPAGLLLRHIAGKPVFLHNSTFPHKGMVTCAHCTSPRRMDGRKYEPARIMTHYESDYGAALKVEMPSGQEVTFVDPEYDTGRWLGFSGRIASNPTYEICRSQQDVEIRGDWKQLVSEARDSHWVMAYGHYLRELGYAARKLGLEWASL